MTSLLSCYWGPEHGRREDLDYFRKLQPADILILQPDVQQISDAYQASPESMITLRRWDWDDNRSKANPDGIYKFLRDAPERYAGFLRDRYAEWIPWMEGKAKSRGLPFPEREQLVAHHANEPDTNHLLPQINRSVRRAAELIRDSLGMPMDGLNLSTGHPAILNAEGWPDWTPLAEALDALTRYDGYAVTHEYFNDLPIEHESVYPWHVGRHAKWAPRGPRWKIGEFNLEMLLNGRRNDHHGWRGILSEDEMVSRTAWYLGQTRDDVVAVRFYMTDYRDPLWSTFDSLPLHDQLIVIGWQYPSEREIEPAATDHSTHFPNVQTGNSEPLEATTHERRYDSPRDGIVTASTLNVRNGPSINADITDTLKQGDHIRATSAVLHPESTWLSLGDGRYVAAEYVAWNGNPQPTAAPEQPQPGDKWQRSLAFTARWEGEYQNFRNDAGNWTGGEVGKGELKGTKYGISAASYPHLDIANLTREQATEIYRRDYWQASGADKLPWPACLIVFDAAVLHGVGAVQAWQREVGVNAFDFAARRLRVYTRMHNWDSWGKAWVRRVADLLEEAATE